MADKKTGGKTGKIGKHSVIGPYRIEKVLGTGGMGTVYLATQLSLNRHVALKVLRKKRLEKEGAIEKFIKEARLTAQLNHPNLVAVHDTGQDEKTGHVYYTMTYVDGPNLRSLVARRGPIELNRAIGLLKDICAGLGHAHQQNMVHRDMKPDNVILMLNGDRPLITDLGLATDRVGNQQLNSRKRFSLIGTPEYSSPDQLRNPHTATAAADIFSVGACFYFMITGKECFDGETLLDLIINVATAEPPNLRKLPQKAQVIIDHFMAKNKDERPQNGDEAFEFLNNLEQGCLPDISSGSESDSVEIDTDGANPRRRRTRRRRR
ncbi:MAG: serine/threonine protein kinase [Planctomycetes bacterium]|nr:serine/threonine protein kinase [Planctomycetota bacterium]